MKILSLIITQKFFDQIIEGTKKEETREIRPKSERKYVILDDEGAIVDIIAYDAIRFYVGYNKDRDTALVKVGGALIETIVADNDEPIYFEENGAQNIMCNIVYSLGEVLETKTK